MLELVLVPGLLAAGVGSLVFIGLDAWTGLGTFSLAIPGLPHCRAAHRRRVRAGRWRSGVLGRPARRPGIRWLGLFLRPHVERRDAAAHRWSAWPSRAWRSRTPRRTGKGSSEVLFSGQSALGPLIQHSASYTVGALLLLLVCKGLAYGVSLSSFRGGPTFPAMFLGAAGGVALSHLPGLPLVDGVAMGIGAMTVVMLRLPLTSVLLATLLLASDGLAVMPLVIVAVVVAYVAAARLAPADDTDPDGQHRGDAATSPAADEAPARSGRHRSPGTGDGDLVQTRSDRTR